MFDAKVLAAVFATLAAFGLALNGGHIDSSNLKSIGTSEEDFNPKNYVPDSLGAFSKYLGNQDPDTEVEGSLVVKNPDKQSISFRSGSLLVKNLNELSIEKRKVYSDDSIKLTGFNGDLNFGEKLKIKGKSKGISTSGVNISGSLDINKEVESSKIEARGIQKSRIDFKDVSGNISSNSTSATVSDSGSNLKIDSFSGNLTFNPENGTLRFEGRVNKLDAGSISFGE